MKTTPFRAADYIGDRADVTALVQYAAELEIENERLLAALNEISANRRSWPDLVEYTQAVLGHQQQADASK